METNGVRYYEFGDFRLDIRRRILLRDGVEQIPLSAKNFDLLLVLVLNEGRILEHDELLDKVWGDTFVEQANLKKNISMLRHILGEQPSQSLYIKTVPRRGYSFVAPVRALPDEVEINVYREFETEVVVEEIIDDEESDTKNQKILASAPAADLSGTPKASFARTKNFYTPLAVFTGLLILAAGFFFARGFWTKPALNYSVENVRPRRLTNEGNLGNSAPISPDGKYIVYPVYFGTQGSLWLRQVETGSVARLTPVEENQFWAYEFSPDGNYVYYIVNHTGDPAQSGVYRISRLGGTPQKLFDRGSGGMQFAPDGSRFVFTRQTDDKSAIEVVTAKADGSDLRRAFVVPENKSVMSLKWSPDNLNILYSVRERGDGKLFAYAAETAWNNDSDAAAENIVFPKQENQVVINAAWLPDRTSMILILREPNADICQIWQYVPATGEKRRVTNDDNTYRALGLTADGKNLSIVQESWKSESWIADSSGVSLDFRPLPNVKNLGAVLFTVDGKLIYESIENQQSTVWLTDLEGNGRQKLTQGQDGIYLFPSLSTDGRYLTFLSNRSGTSQIWRINPDGTDPQQLTGETARQVGLRSKLLSDGQTLLFMTHTQQTGWILQKRAADGKIQPLTLSDTGLWSISPDEKSLAVSQRDEKTKKYRIHVQNLSTGEIVKVFDFSPVRQISWTRDGKALVYISPKQDADELVLQPIDETPARILTGTRGERIFSFDWSASGDKLVLVRSKHAADAFLLKAYEE